MESKWRNLFFFGLIVLVLTTNVAAQSNITGAVQGTVKDPDGAALPGVTVTVTSPALITGKAFTVTDERGIYRFPSLPVGNYKIEAVLSGFGTVQRPNLRVSVGQVLAVDLTMKVAAMSQEITVTAEAPVLSVVANNVATNFDTSYIETAPVPRNFYSVIAQAPGVNSDYTSSSGSAMLAYGGTSEGQNAFTMDGVNVADAAAGQHWILPSIQWMEEIQIGGLGANAEYGGYTGGIINGVTKSGGNEFSGGLEYYYQPSSWVANNNPGAVADEFKFNDLSISLGGRVIPDKIWFFVSGEQWQQVTTPYGAIDTSDRKIPRYLGKLTYQHNDANRISLMLEHDAVTNERRGISDLTWPDATSKQDGPGSSMSLSWESLINQSNFTNVRITGYDGRDDYLPYHGHNTPGHIDYNNTEIAWGNQDIQQLNSRRIEAMDASWNLYKDGLFGGNDSHTFKFGGEYERGRSSDIWTRNGGFTYYDDSSECDSWEAYLANPSCGAYFIERGYGEYNERMQYKGLALYAQDSMRLNRLTFNYGLRYGSYDGGFQKGHGDTSVYNTNFIDPRVGIVFDLKGDARTAIKAHWGRYHDKLYTYLYDREASGNAVVPDQDCYWNSDTNAFDDCEEPTVIAARMGDVNQAQVDEALLTLEQQIGQTMIVGVDFADRRFRNIMAMVNANLDYELYTATGNPLTGGTLPIYDLRSPQDFVLTTDNGAYRDFQSVTGRFQKRHSNRWSAMASVVWTDLNGNILKNNGYANEYRDLNGLTNADGRMDYAFSEWEGKLSGSVDLPFGFQASANYTYLSGWYWTPYVRISGLDYNYSVGRDINLTERGSQQLPDRNLVDARIAWGHDLAGMRLTASIEAFNLFNSDTVLDVYNRWGTYYLEDAEWSKRSNYGSTYQIEKPREIRAGIRLAF